VLDIARQPKAEITTWRTPIAFNTAWYVNRGSRTAVIESVPLLHPLYQAMSKAGQ
jgi:hypothetical protein